MIRRVALTVCFAAIVSPALATDCPDYMSAAHCSYFYGTQSPPPEVDLRSFERAPRAYAPTYQEPIPERPDTRYDAYRLQDAIRQIPGYNLR